MTTQISVKTPRKGGGVLMAAKVLYMVSQRSLGVHSLGLAWLLQSNSCQAARFPKKAEPEYVYLQPLD